MKKMLRKISKPLVVFCLTIAACLSVQANQIVLINGNLYTNLNLSVGAGQNTNTLGVLTNNVQLGNLLNNTGGQGTNFFSLSPNAGPSNPQTGTGGTQLNTNVYPAESFTVASGYPGTLYGPYRTFQDTLAASQCATTNAASPAITFIRRYAGYDGAIWVSNIFYMTVTIPANSLYGISTSNFQSSFYQIAVQQDEYTTVGATNSVLTNIVNSINYAPGL